MERSTSKRTTLVVHPMVLPDAHRHHAGKAEFLRHTDTAAPTLSLKLDLFPTKSCCRWTDRYQMIPCSLQGFPIIPFETHSPFWKANPANLSLRVRLLSGILLFAAQWGWTAWGCWAALSVRAGRWLTASSSFCWGMRMLSCSFLLPLSPLSLSPFCQPRISLILVTTPPHPLLLAVSAAPHPQPTVMQLSHLSDSACFVNSTSRLLLTKMQTQTHPHTNHLLQTTFYSSSIPLSLDILFPTDTGITADAVIFDVI